MLGFLNILSRFHNKFNIFNITEVQMLNSSFHDIITDTMHYLFRGKVQFVFMGRVQRTSFFDGRIYLQLFSGEIIWKV